VLQTGAVDYLPLPFQPSSQQGQAAICLEESGSYLPVEWRPVVEVRDPYTVRVRVCV
jgi:hypothetical protein